MPNYVITFDIHDDDDRETRDEFERILDDLGLFPEANQTTYYGHHPYNPYNFIDELIVDAMELDWTQEDTVTVYYPNSSYGSPDIEWYPVKIEGNEHLSPIQ